MKHLHCSACIANGKKRKSKATHMVKLDGIEIPLCDKHYKEFEEQEEFLINSIDYGDKVTEE